VATAGAAAEYDLEAAAQAVAGSEVTVTLDLKAGKEEATMWTCDFTADYVRINASYRT
jgi:glutamate N-acetyltransferase / amino-acid N-acetyltransferase